MSTAAGRHRAGSLPGTVKVRLSGDRPDVDALAAVLANDPAVEILTGPGGPRRNRREPGHRVYLTVRIPPWVVKPRQGQRTAAKAIRRPRDPITEASSIMTPDQLADQLTGRLDGPHADEHTTGAARLAAEAVRFLNYATGFHAPEGLTYPATVY